jgi:hypothetical protein
MNIPAGVYRLKKIEKNYTLIPDIPRFITPGKVYGDMLSMSIRYWNTFATGRQSLGILLLGHSGTGKTETAQITSNFAIDNNLPVIVVKEITGDIDVIRYLAQLENCVIFFDEFGKNFRSDIQDKMLSLLSDSSKQRLFIVADNHKNGISNFILNRPGRFHYKQDFSRISESTFEEYCADLKPAETFYKDLKSLYNRSAVFSFDHLRALVKEHLSYPKDTVEYLLTVLNLDILATEVNYVVRSVKNNKDETVEIISRTVNRKRLENGNNEWVDIKSGPSIKINYKDVINVSDNSLTVKSDGCTVYLELEDVTDAQKHANESGSDDYKIGMENLFKKLGG